MGVAGGEVIAEPVEDEAEVDAFDVADQKHDSDTETDPPELAEDIHRAVASTWRSGTPLP